MNYGQVKAQFQAVLNRRDITPTLTEAFIKNAIQRAQRSLRVPAMEKSVVVSFLKDDENIDLPGDLLQLINVVWDQEVQYEATKLERVDLHNVLNLRNQVGTPYAYARQDGALLIGPKPWADGNIRMDYYADFSDLSADTDSNWLTDIAPDLIVYGALSFASDYYLDNRRDQFEERFNSAMAELTNQMQLDELSAGAAIAPAYGMNFQTY
jgi:hypothetical protein